MKIEFSRQEKFSFLREVFSEQFPGYELPEPEYVPAYPNDIRTPWIWRLEIEASSVTEEQRCFIEGFLAGIDSTDI